MDNAATKSEVLAIINTYDGMLRPLVMSGKRLPQDIVEARTKWCAVLARMESR